MILSRLQGRRFFNMFDALTVYANKRLQSVEETELITTDARGIDDKAQGEVAYDLWQNLNVIDDFVAQNPAGLSDGELACVASWREGLTDTFLVDVFPDGELRFVSSGYAFEVSGISKEIASMLPGLPAAVHTTLLPFDGRIVYAEYMLNHLIEFGEGMLSIFDEEINRLFDEGRIVRDADEFVQIAQNIRADELARDTEQLVADLENGAFGAAGPGDGHGHHHHHHDHDCDCGHEHDDYDEDFDEDFDEADYIQHRGALAGLSFDEREQAIRDHMMKEDDSVLERLVELLDDDCETIGITTSLAELLAAENPHDMRLFSTYLGLETPRDMDDEDVIQRIVERVADADTVQVIVDDLTEHHIASMQKLAERGGRWEVDEDDITSLRDLPIHEVGLSYVFHEGPTFTFVMPDEVLAIAKDIDWDGAIAKARTYRQLVDLVDVMAELRGIAPVADVVEESRRCYPDGLQEMSDIVSRILLAVTEGIAGYELLETPTREMYVLHYELFWAYQEVMGLEDEEYVIEPVNHGELGELLEGLLDQQKGKDPRPVAPEMLQAQSLMEWKLHQEPTQAFVRYLDEHVPAACEDYYFADKVIEELLADSMWGIIDNGAQRLFDILEHNDFIPEVDQMQDVLDLWSNLNNGLPIWPNNGWAPMELASTEAGGSMFFNPDGSIKKIGRNDPCPCGSGLKYKKCHGR